MVLTRTELNDLWRMMHDAEIVARLYGLGFGDQPLVWPKHEQAVFAESMSSGKWRAMMNRLKEAYGATPVVPS